MLYTKPVEEYADNDLLALFEEVVHPEGQYYSLLVRALNKPEFANPGWSYDRIFRQFEVLDKIVSIGGHFVIDSKAGTTIMFSKPNVDISFNVVGKEHIFKAILTFATFYFTAYPELLPSIELDEKDSSNI